MAPKSEVEADNGKPSATTSASGNTTGTTAAAKASAATASPPVIKGSGLQHSAATAAIAVKGSAAGFSGNAPNRHGRH